MVRGKAAHAGRDFDRGRNAVVAAADLAIRLHRLNESSPGSGVTVNVARFDGGSALNVVPDLAIIRLNARAAGPEQMAWIEKSFHDCLCLLCLQRVVNGELGPAPVAEPE